MNFKSLVPSLVLAGLCLYTPAATARKGSPHSFTANSTFNTVELGWKAPTEAKTLKWHSGRDYNGSQGIQTSTQRPAVIYVSSLFTAADLQDFVGESITSVDYFEYRPVTAVTAIIYEDETVVREQAFDLSNYKKNTIRNVELQNPYVIPAGKNVRVALKIEHGANLDFTAIMDEASSGKGDYYSYDGRTWRHNGDGDYLVTAHLANDADEEAQGYNIYLDGNRWNTETLTGKSAVIENVAEGNHTFAVKAVYGGEELSSVVKTLEIRSAASYFPNPAATSGQVDNFTVTFGWNKPLLRGNDNVLSWSNMTKGNNIGGTASSNTKIWIKQEFSGSDLLSYAGGKISAINAHFSEAEVLSMKIWVMKNGQFIYSEDVPEEAIAAIKANQWSKFQLTTPVDIESGASYTIGYYMLQTPKKHPVSVDNAPAVGSKNNSFSTSSPNSSNFLNSKPSWRTLASGGIEGGWMLSADVTGVTGEILELASYNIYKDGTLLRSGFTGTSLVDAVEAPGSYVYGVEAVGTNGKRSETVNRTIVVKLPAQYRAPLLNTADFNDETRTLNLGWGMDVELKHHGEATYKAGFEEDMTMAFGTRFSASELAPYQGFNISKLNFIIGQDIPAGFKLQIYKATGDPVTSVDVPAGSVNPLGYYSITLPEPVAITGTEDLIFAYNATLPGGTSPIVVDAGPRVEGGAVIRLAGAPNWMNLGTINPSYNNYNIVISAVAVEGNEPQQTPGKIELIGSSLGSGIYPQAVVLNAEDINFSIDAANVPVTTATEAKHTALQPASYNVYCNNELLLSTDKRSASVKLPGYDNYLFQVSAVYPVVGESELSDGVTISNPIEQLSVAPCRFTKADEKTFTWSAPENADVLTYCTANPKSFGVGMTGSGMRESYIVIKYAPEDLAAKAGSRITHIKFGLYETNVNTASVVIFKNLNLVYEQAIPVSSLSRISDGYNEIRLNEAFEITPGDDIMIGYHLTYQNGVKPMLFDAGPAVDGKGNLLSASAGDTSWKTLKGMSSSMDGNWRIYATLQSAHVIDSTTSAPRKSPAMTYNLYKVDDENSYYTAYGTRTKVASAIDGTSYAFDSKIPIGVYFATAVNNGIESAPSNYVRVGTGAVDGIGTETMISYNALTCILTAGAEQNGVLYDATGRQVMKVEHQADLSDLPDGVYIYHGCNGESFKFVK